MFSDEGIEDEILAMKKALVKNYDPNFLDKSESIQNQTAFLVLRDYEVQLFIIQAGK